MKGIINRILATIDSLIGRPTRSGNLMMALIPPTLLSFVTLYFSDAPTVVFAMYMVVVLAILAYCSFVLRTFWPRTRDSFRNLNGEELRSPCAPIDAGVRQSQTISSQPLESPKSVSMQGSETLDAKRHSR